MGYLLNNGDKLGWWYARNILDFFGPVWIAIEALNRNENTLLRADEVLKFFIKKNVH